MPGWPPAERSQFFWGQVPIFGENSFKKLEIVMDSVIYVVFFKALLHQPARRWLLKKRDETKKKSMGMKL